MVLLSLFLLVGCSTTPSITETAAISTDTPAAATSVSGDAPYLPNPATQPGVYSPAVTQDNIQSTICVSGYTSTVRPPVSYTDALKKQQISQYGYSDTKLADYEEDHLVALEVGGDPKDPKNLWPQPRHTQPWNASDKDRVENVLNKMVCDGQMPLDTARRALATDWVAAYQKYIGQSLLAVTALPTEP
jgi:hypothetical protein